MANYLNIFLKTKNIKLLRKPYVFRCLSSITGTYLVFYEYFCTINTKLPINILNLY